MRADVVCLVRRGAGGRHMPNPCDSLVDTRGNGVYAYDRTSRPPSTLLIAVLVVTSDRLIRLSRSDRDKPVDSPCERVLSV